MGTVSFPLVVAGRVGVIMGLPLCLLIIGRLLVLATSRGKEEQGGGFRQHASYKGYHDNVVIGAVLDPDSSM